MKLKKMKKEIKMTKNMLKNNKIILNLLNQYLA